MFFRSQKHNRTISKVYALSPQDAESNFKRTQKRTI